MTAALAPVIPLHREPGRPSNAALQLENRTLRAALERVTEERDDLDDELSAYVAERLANAGRIVNLSRRAQRFVAAGWRPTQHLLELEELGLREQVRAGAMRPAPDAA